ncbi:AraC family transcriptional regulator [Defluviitalea saccharophila]|uniref:AraC family transcriptional regulator n=1 Tax=Defluviitalea saccharophila TaxID=879970 RepID=A0ABZ2Y0T7_9FIRM
MNLDLNYFIKTLPQDMYSKTKAHICKHMAIFEPEEYVLGKVLRADDYHFLLFFSDAPITKINNCAYKPQKGSLLVIQPWDEVYGVPDDNKKTYGKYINITVEKSFFRRIAKEAAGGGEYEFKHIQNVYSKQLLELIGNFQREMMDHGESFPLMLESICIQIVFQLLRDLSSEPGTNQNKISKDNKYIKQAIQFMQEYYSANISINDICNLIYLSPCHFKRVFKDCTGQTPYQYLMKIRLEKAKEILKEKESSMEEVARLCGFVNTGHFATVFKRNIGMSPSEYRKQAL